MKLFSSIPLICFLFLLANLLVIEAHSRRRDGKFFPKSIKPFWKLSNKQLKCGIGNYRHKMERIIGGRDARPGEFPYQALIMIRGEIEGELREGICTGAIVDKRHILTAAHCVTGSDKSEKRTLLVDLGCHTIGCKGGHLAHVERVLVHENYHFDEESGGNDIAMLRLTEDIKYGLTKDGFGSINRVCLPDQEEGNVKDGDRVLLVGWGAIDVAGYRAQIVQAAELRILDIHECASIVKIRNEYTIDTREQICTMSRPNESKSPFVGDSGGALVKLIDGQFYTVGIVSNGDRFDPLGSPTVYTRINHHLNWIREAKRKLERDSLISRISDLTSDY